MTEAEWLTAADPTPMLEFLRGKASDRKLRLFACECWRVVLPFFGRWSREAVKASESYADGTATREALLNAWRQTRKPPRTAALFDAYTAAEKAFRPKSINPSWHTPKVINAAQHIYDERSFDRLPELADALVDAGCDNADILAHCRGPGEHVLGCWVVDLLLGKR